jgi:hypothetical protein
MRTVARFLILFLIVLDVAFSQFAAHAQGRFDTQVTQIGDAQAQTIVEAGFFPDRQSVVFWHDPDWSIDLVVPAKERVFSVRVQYRKGKASLVTLPKSAMQILSVARAPGDKAIVSTDCGSECLGFVILDLKKATVVDEVGSSGIEISPNRRFILFDSWFANWDDSVPHEFRLYDVLRTPKENTCGYTVLDSKHEKLNDYLRGLQVFPSTPTCSNNEENLGFDYGGRFTWSPDSSRIVFAVMREGRMSLVLIKMPAGALDLPETSVYALKGTQDVCAGEKYCDYRVIGSLRWDGDSVKASFQRQSELTLPVTAFIPASARGTGR